VEFMEWWHRFRSHDELFIGMASEQWIECLATASRCSPYSRKPTHVPSTYMREIEDQLGDMAYESRVELS
jgi:hypothetical protein